MAFITGNGFNNTVRKIIVQPTTNRIITSGSFTTYSGVTENRIAHLSTDGSIDDTFATGTGFSCTVFSSAIQSNCRIVNVGSFTTYNGSSVSRIARICINNVIDNTLVTGTGFGACPICAIIQADQKIVVGGSFTTYSGVTKNRIVRLCSTGRIDSTFVIGTGFSGGTPTQSVCTIAQQIDSKLVVGGTFTSYNGTAVSRIARLNSNGSIDNTFATGTGFAGSNVSVNAIAIQNDQKVLVGGSFNTYDGTPVVSFVRLNTNGSLDNVFSSFGGAVNVIAIQPDQKILVGGGFLLYDGTIANRIIRLNTDGTVDTTFNVGMGFDTGQPAGPLQVNAITIQLDGKILIGGSFLDFNGITVNRIIRLHSNGLIDNQPPTVTGTTISGITQTTAIGNGNVIDEGDSTVTSRGIVYSLLPSPTTGDTVITTSGTTGVFTISITGLTIDTIYFVRAFAVNLGGISYGDEISFETNGESTAIILSTDTYRLWAKVGYIVGLTPTDEEVQEQITLLERTAINLTENSVDMQD